MSDMGGTEYQVDTGGEHFVGGDAGAARDIPVVEVTYDLIEGGDSEWGDPASAEVDPDLLPHAEESGEDVALDSVETEEKSETSEAKADTSAAAEEVEEDLEERAEEAEAEHPEEEAEATGRRSARDRLRGMLEGLVDIAMAPPEEEGRLTVVRRPVSIASHEPSEDEEFTPRRRRVPGETTSEEASPAEGTGEQGAATPAARPEQQEAKVDTPVADTAATETATPELRPEPAAAEQPATPRSETVTEPVARPEPTPAAAAAAEQPVEQKTPEAVPAAAAAADAPQYERPEAAATQERTEPVTPAAAADAPDLSRPAQSEPAAAEQPAQPQPTVEQAVGGVAVNQPAGERVEAMVSPEPFAGPGSSPEEGAGDGGGDTRTQQFDQPDTAFPASEEQRPVAEQELARPGVDQTNIAAATAAAGAASSANMAAAQASAAAPSAATYSAAPQGTSEGVTDSQEPASTSALEGEARESGDDVEGDEGDEGGVGGTGSQSDTSASSGDEGSAESGAAVGGSEE